MNSNLSMSGGGHFVDRGEIAKIITPRPTSSWHPVPHIDVVNMMTHAIEAKNMRITGEQFGLAREGQKLFGVMQINRTSSPEWSRCIGIRNSHDKSLSVGLTAGISVCVCSNLCFGGSTVIKRRHSSGIIVEELVFEAIDALEDEFLTIETVAETLKTEYINDDDARKCLVRAAESDAIPSCDILQVFKEFKKPTHEEFEEPTKWSFLNAFTETAKKYSPARADKCYLGLTKLFGLNGKQAQLWS
ncbi:MAG: DUF932 domain-containing protein [Alphaproteobacteria bacterium]|nr:DUF932 domain-containing protein [Alphaproteobacteria bacterium]